MALNLSPIVKRTRRTVLDGLEMESKCVISLAKSNESQQTKTIIAYHSSTSLGKHLTLFTLLHHIHTPIVSCYTSWTGCLPLQLMITTSQSKNYAKL